MENRNSPPQYPPGYLEADISSHLYASTTVILVICNLLLALRLYARSLTDGRRGWDDFFLLPSWMFLVGLCILMYVAIPRAGIGRHMAAVHDKIETWNLVIYVMDWFYVPANMCSRLSVVALYLRIFRKRKARYFCWAVIVFLIGTCIAFIVSANLECIPLQHTWNVKIPGRCFNVQLWWKVSNIPNVVSDIAILVLPIETIWRLQAPVAKKAGIWLVCLTGSIGLFASCMRTGVFFTALRSTPADPTWTSTPLLVWTVVESGMYNAAACLICLRPLYAKFPKYLRDRWATYEKSMERSSSGKVTTIGSRQMNRWWLKMDDNQGADSTSRIVESECKDEDIELSPPQPAVVSEDSISVPPDCIIVDRTFEVFSTPASPANGPYQASIREQISTSTFPTSRLYP